MSKLSKSTRDKISKAMRGRKLSAEHKRKLSEAAHKRAAYVRQLEAYAAAAANA